MAKSNSSDIPLASPSQHPFRRAVLRGLAIVMPPLLTVVLFIWAWSMIESYVLRPTESIANFAIRLRIERVERGIPPEVSNDRIWVERADGQLITVSQLFNVVPPRNRLQSRVKATGGEIVRFQIKEGDKDLAFVPLNNDVWIPDDVRSKVAEDPGTVNLLTASPTEVYIRYVQLEHLPRWRVIPVFLLVFVSVLYLAGKFMALSAGRITWNGVEAMIRRLPVIRNVYSSVKQVTDFVFSEQEVQFTRVVAVQYPRKGIWSVGFVTGESMLDMRTAADEPVISVLMPTSPMPATGFTITVRKSETIDLDISIDQAIQFVISCGVVVPPNQQSGVVASDTAARISAAVSHRILRESSGNGRTGEASIEEKKTVDQADDE